MMAGTERSFYGFAISVLLLALGALGHWSVSTYMDSKETIKALRSDLWEAELAVDRLRRERVSEIESDGETLPPQNLPTE